MEMVWRDDGRVGKEEEIWEDGDGECGWGREESVYMYMYIVGGEDEEWWSEMGRRMEYE